MARIPAEVTAVRGCDCGGLSFHTTTCSLGRLPYEVALAAVDEAIARTDDWCRALPLARRSAQGD